MTFLQRSYCIAGILCYDTLCRPVGGGGEGALGWLGAEPR